MNRTYKVLVLFTLVSFVLVQVWAGAKPSHAFHTSLAQVTYDAKNKSFEIIIRLFIDDLESALQKETGNTSIKLDENDKNDPLLEKYVQKHFGMFNKNSKRVAQKYIGKEFDVDVMWIYLEIPFSESLNGSLLHNSILLDEYNDQVNMVNIIYQGKKNTLLFKQGAEQQKLGI